MKNTEKGRGLFFLTIKDGSKYNQKSFCVETLNVFYSLLSAKIYNIKTYKCQNNPLIINFNLKDTLSKLIVLESILTFSKVL